MAALSNTAKFDALSAIAPSGNTLKVAFYSAAATIVATTAAYSSTNEVTDTNIPAGGLALGARAAITASDGSVSPAGADWPDVGPVTPAASFVFQKILMYDTARSNRAVMFHDYGTPQTWNAGTAYTLTIPGTGTYLITLA